MEGIATFRCPVCGELNEVAVELNEGNRLDITEDSAVCCRPNVIHIEIVGDGEITMTIEFEG